MVTFNCNNKGCNKASFDSLLDESTNEIICSMCGKPITNVTDFIKKSMKSMGQVIKPAVGNKFIVQCLECRFTGQPIFENNELHCNKCGLKLKLTPQYEKVAKEYLKPKA